MKQTIYKSQFVQAFKNMGREDNFTPYALEKLFNYFEELEDSTDTEMELDVIAICCEYKQYENLEEFHRDYEKQDYPTIDDIETATTVP